MASKRVQDEINAVSPLVFADWEEVKRRWPGLTVRQQRYLQAVHLWALERSIQEIADRTGQIEQKQSRLYVLSLLALVVGIFAATYAAGIDLPLSVLSALVAGGTAAIMRSIFV